MLKKGIVRTLCRPQNLKSRQPLVNMKRKSKAIFGGKKIETKKIYSLYAFAILNNQCNKKKKNE